MISTSDQVSDLMEAVKSSLANQFEKNLIPHVILRIYKIEVESELLHSFHLGLDAEKPVSSGHGFTSKLWFERISGDEGIEHFKKIIIPMLWVEKDGGVSFIYDLGCWSMTVSVDHVLEMIGEVLEIPKEEALNLNLLNLERRKLIIDKLALHATESLAAAELHKKLLKRTNLPTSSDFKIRNKPLEPLLRMVGGKASEEEHRIALNGFTYTGLEFLHDEFENGELFSDIKGVFKLYLDRINFPKLFELLVQEDVVADSFGRGQHDRRSIPSQLVASYLELVDQRDMTVFLPIKILDSKDYVYDCECCSILDFRFFKMLIFK